jgi:hypothetical protein
MVSDFFHGLWIFFCRESLSFGDGDFAGSRYMAITIQSNHVQLTAYILHHILSGELRVRDINGHTNKQ